MLIAYWERATSLFLTEPTSIRWTSGAVATFEDCVALAANPCSYHRCGVGIELHIYRLNAAETLRSRAPELIVHAAAPTPGGGNA